MMLRIAHVMGMNSEKYGGMERFELALAQECARRGHRLYCVWEARPASEQFNQDLSAAGVESIGLPARSHPIRFFGQIALWLYRRGVHVMHAYFNPAALLALAAARVVGVPVPVGSLVSGLGCRGPQGMALRSRWLLGVRRSLAAQIFTGSRGVDEELHRLGLGGRKTIVQHLGISTVASTRSREEMRRELGIGQEDLVVACVAFHAPMKGVDLLVRAAGILAPQVPRLRIVQVGSFHDSEYSARLRQLAEELGVGDRIIWTGVRNDVPDILQCADVYCQPSRLEALAFRGHARGRHSRGGSPQSDRPVGGTGVSGEPGRCPRGFLGQGGGAAANGRVRQAIRPPGVFHGERHETAG
jgi:glycosyltransferase involved in cell wall biosynthesis